MNTIKKATKLKVFVALLIQKLLKLYKYTDIYYNKSQLMPAILGEIENP